MNTFQVTGWNASMHSPVTIYTLSKATSLAPGIDTVIGFNVEVEGYFPDYTEEASTLLADKLRSAGIMSASETLKSLGA